MSTYTVAGGHLVPIEAPAFVVETVTGRSYWFCGVCNDVGKTKQSRAQSQPGADAHNKAKHAGGSDA